MDNNQQDRTPFFSAVVDYINENTSPFDVPGHKMGGINNEMRRYLGKRVFAFDVNAPKGLDNLSHPKGVIKEAESLFAHAFKAKRSFFLINGSSCGILSMILYACKANEKIILPRNVHKSFINALILSGAIPVFVKPTIDPELGIANGITYESLKLAIEENQDAKAVAIINPTYFGVTSDLVKIVELIKENKMLALIDEAHGSHFSFSSKLPISAMEAKADMSVLSIHKTGGSLTQSSVLLVNDERIDCTKLQNIINMLQSTSPSTLLMASLDVTRKFLFFKGKKGIEKALELAKNAVSRIKEIKGIYIAEEQYFKSKKEFGFDSTRLVIRVNELGLSGFEIFNILRREYGVQLELAETYCILAIVSLGSTQKHIDRLVYALEDLSNRFFEKFEPYLISRFKYSFPEMEYRPRLAFHAPSKKVNLDSDAIGEVSTESIMIYPPGIPLIIPGEKISEELVDMISFYEEQGSTIFKQDEGKSVNVIDKDNWDYLEEKE